MTRRGGELPAPTLGVLTALPKECAAVRVMLETNAARIAMTSTSARSHPMPACIASPSDCSWTWETTARRSRQRTCCTTSPFVGRAAPLARLDQLLVEGRTDRWVVVTGGPGIEDIALLQLSVRENAPPEIAKTR